jgi:hypothetical protein
MFPNYITLSKNYNIYLFNNIIIYYIIIKSYNYNNLLLYLNG